MGKPTRHRGKWRIRWTDENGRRRSEVFAEYRDALFQLRRHEREVEEIKRGLKLGLPPDKTFHELCDYWVEKRVPLKVSGHHDASIIRAHLRPAFGRLRLRDISLEHIDQFKAERIHLSRKTVRAGLRWRACHNPREGPFRSEEEADRAVRGGQGLLIVERRGREPSPMTARQVNPTPRAREKCMRSVFAYLLNSTVDEVARFLDRTCPSQKGPPWIWKSQGDVSLYIRCQPGMAVDGDREDGDSVLAALGAPAAVTVIADVSGRHSGDDDVRGLLSVLLRSFPGVACDDYTSHAWTLEEVLSGHRVEGHPFFDYQGWYQQDARK